MRHTSRYIWFHSARGSTYTSIVPRFSAPSPGFGAEPVAAIIHGPAGDGDCRKSAFSPFALTAKLYTPLTNGSVLRVLKSNLVTLVAGGSPNRGTSATSLRKRIPVLPASSCT